RRIITSELAIDPARFPDAIDFFAATGAEVPFSTAIHNSALFPYLDAAGTIWTLQAGRRVKTDRIVDGGYFENFGAATAYDLADALMSLDGSLKIFVIQISSDPGFADSDARRQAWLEALAGTLDFASDATAPLVTIAQTRGSLGYRATKILCQQAGGARYAHFRLTGSEPLSWAMSKAVADQLESMEWDQEVNVAAMNRVRSWFAASEPAPATCFASDPAP